MARFKNDLFISYAHADNKSGWVDAFHRSLDAWLGVLGVNARIWRDPKLLGADAFSDEIVDQLKESALLISILSPNGMESTWCMKERQKFEECAASTGGFRIGNLVRALKVVMTPADGDAHRQVFGTTGYEFFERDSQSGLYDHYLPSDPRFEKGIDRLAQEIKHRLHTLASIVSEPAKPVIYVAEVSADVEADRSRLVDQLAAWGYRVAPAGALPIHASELRAAIQSALADAVISIHFFSDKRGAIPDQEEKSILALQYEIASARGLDRIVWVLPDMQLHPTIEKELEIWSASGFERLEGDMTLECVKEILAERLKMVESARATSHVRQKFVIYVVCDREDRAQALALKSFLDTHGFNVWLPPATITDRSRRDKDHRETLKMSDAVILYWGVADEEWFRGAFRGLTNARIRMRRNRPFVAEALYLTGPLRPEKGEWRRCVDLVVEQPNGFEPEALRPFLDHLRRATETSTQ